MLRPDDASTFASLLNGVEYSPPMPKPSIVGTMLTTGLAHSKVASVLTV
jgi:hypothetical protein